MKFRNRETGEVFFNIEDAKEKFCPNMKNPGRIYMEEARTCMLCPIGSTMNGNFVTCENFVSLYPEKAAKIMGYEIIEDGDDKMETKKSYLAEILGLEEDEVFRVEGRNIDFRIHNGNREMWNEYERKWTPSACESELVNIINKRNKIVKVKQVSLTEQEKKICEDCGAKWVSLSGTETNFVILWREKPDNVIDVNNNVNYFSTNKDYQIALFDKRIFKSVKPGDLIEVMGETQ